MTCPRWFLVAPLLFVLWAALASACGGRGSPGDDSQPGGGSDAAAPGPTLDDCFANLPAPVGVQMVATKSSNDGHLRLRIALEAMGGTAGSYGWALLRLGVERNGAVTCIADAAKLTYRGSHHNCDDKASAAAGTMTFDLTAPDRGVTNLTVRDGGTVVEDSVLLEDTTCTMSSSFSPVECRSGGPC